MSPKELADFTIRIARMFKRVLKRVSQVEEQTATIDDAARVIARTVLDLGEELTQAISDAHHRAMWLYQLDEDLDRTSKSADRATKNIDNMARLMHLGAERVARTEDRITALEERIALLESKGGEA